MLRDMVEGMFKEPKVLTRQQIIMAVKSVVPAWAKKLIERLQEAHDEDADDGGSKWFFARFNFPAGMETSTEDKGPGAMPMQQDEDVILVDEGPVVRDENKHLWQELGY